MLTCAARTQTAGRGTGALKHCDTIAVGLRACTAVTDASGLRNVKHLDLSHCPGVVNVASLGGALSLNLQR